MTAFDYDTSFESDAMLFDIGGEATAFGESGPLSTNPIARDGELWISHIEYLDSDDPDRLENVVNGIAQLLESTKDMNYDTVIFQDLQPKDAAVINALATLHSQRAAAADKVLFVPKPNMDVFTEGMTTTDKSVLDLAEILRIDQYRDSPIDARARGELAVSLMMGKNNPADSSEFNGPHMFAVVKPYLKKA